MNFYELLQQISSRPELHARWLNALSYMEHAGARKISACAHKSKVDLIQLKHAAEEHRHAYYLKKQIRKIGPDYCPDYSPEYLLAATASRQYLHRLDMLTCRYLIRHAHVERAELPYVAYLFVTYAIEVRADELYPVYQQVLTEQAQRVMVKSIILEEAGHLEEMIQQLQGFSPEWAQHARHIGAMEQQLFEAWKQALYAEVNELIDA